MRDPLKCEFSVLFNCNFQEIDFISQNITTGICEYRLKTECFHLAVCCMNYERRMNVLS